MAGVGKDLKDHLTPAPLSWTPLTRPGYSKPHPIWPDISDIKVLENICWDCSGNKGSKS